MPALRHDQTDPFSSTQRFLERFEGTVMIESLDLSEIDRCLNQARNQLDCLDLAIDQLRENKDRIDRYLKQGLDWDIDQLLESKDLIDRDITLTREYRERVVSTMVRYQDENDLRTGTRFQDPGPSGGQS